ncbi:MAG: nitrate/nitrite transporter NrtS [Chloroflexi bacterium]|nr:nitrate/nitrite transporter NrtS [Chloroflexota bacterium]MBA3894304.1 nitrate/nitrite transporter NrtS [Gemmatimonadales bacterium]
MQLACAPTVVRRSLKYAIVVGALLILINHGDAILRGDLPPARLLRMLLTIAVPYTVSTLSSVEAMRQLRGDHPAPPPATSSRSQS